MRDFKDLKIAVAGTGYVGLSIATLLSQHHKVTAVDIIPEKVELMVFIIAANIPTFPSAVFSFVNVLTFSWHKCALLPYSRC